MIDSRCRAYLLRQWLLPKYFGCKTPKRLFTKYQVFERQYSYTLAITGRLFADKVPMVRAYGRLAFCLILTKVYEKHSCAYILRSTRCILIPKYCVSITHDVAEDCLWCSVEKWAYFVRKYMQGLLLHCMGISVSAKDLCQGTYIAYIEGVTVSVLIILGTEARGLWISCRGRGYLVSSKGRPVEISTAKHWQGKIINNNERVHCWHVLFLLV